MPRNALPNVLALLSCAGLLASCAPATPRSDDAHETFESKDFSVEEKRVAMTLSIANSTAVETVSSPYDQALLCAHALEGMSDRVRDAEGIDSTVRRGFEQAQTLYQRRAERLGEAEGKPSAEIRSDRIKVNEDYSDPGANARIAMSCLRRLI